MLYLGNGGVKCLTAQVMHSYRETCFCSQLAFHLFHRAERPHSPTGASVLQCVPFMFMAGNTTDILGRLPLLWLVAGSRRWSWEQRRRRSPRGKYNAFLKPIKKTAACVLQPVVVQELESSLRRSPLGHSEVINDGMVIWEGQGSIHKAARILKM